MAQLNVVVRTLIRIAFGTALPSGTHQDALESYKRATELNPGRLIHRQACPWMQTFTEQSPAPAFRPPNAAIQTGHTLFMSQTLIAWPSSAMIA